MMHLPYLNQAKSEISHLSSEGLQDLLNNDDKLEEYVNDTLKSLDGEKKVLIARNRNTAEENINKESEIVERKTRISELQEKGKTLCSSIQEKIETLKSQEGDRTPDTALALLQSKAAECEEQSDEILAKFSAKSISIEDFLEQFSKNRTCMHSRKLKAEKMAEIIRTEPVKFY